jgi:anthraniloyl-CoA monooxygenase
MRVLCVGGGPAGLYLAIMLKQHDPGHHITVLERNPVGVAHGWGVVFWNDLLETLRAADPDSAREIHDSAFQWRGQQVELGGAVAARSGGGYGIGRHRLLEILGKRAASLGVQVGFEYEYDAAAPPPDVDLLVASDGAGSRLRKRHAEEFGTAEVVGRNRYVWLGSSRVFEAFTFAFARTDAGHLWMHAYAFADDCSTCIVECPPETWVRLGFERHSTEESLRLLEKIFAEQLHGHPLMVQDRDRDRMPWLAFRTVMNRRWHHGNIVLAGDAAHTTHFAIGSGTKLALEDAIALASALRRRRDVPAALEAYGATRRNALLLPQREAANSARWFEQIDRFATTDPSLFAFLLHRRSSSFLATLPTPAYRLARVAHEVPVLRELWARVGSRQKQRYVRRHGC